MTTLNPRLAILIILVLFIFAPIITFSAATNASTQQNTVSPGQSIPPAQQPHATSPGPHTGQQQPQPIPETPQQQIVQPGPPGLMPPGAAGMTAPGAPGIIPQPIPPTREAQPLATPSDIHFVQVRVIHAAHSGIEGSIPQELIDMRELLEQAFDYSSFELTNTIRLSLFTDEDATAMVFPDHYLRIIPRTNSPQGLRARLELYHSTLDRSHHFHADASQPMNPAMQTHPFEHGAEPTATIPMGQFPVVSSAVLIRPGAWEAFGGIPLNPGASSDDMIGAHTQVGRQQPQLRALRTGQRYDTIGAQQHYLILAVQLESRQVTTSE